MLKMRILLGITICLAFAPSGFPQGARTDVQAILDSVNAKVDRERLAVEGFRTLPVAIPEIEKNDLGLTTDRVRTRIELKLRAAGINPTVVSPAPLSKYYLQVWVGVLGTSFQVKVEFHRSAEWTLPDKTVVDSRPVSWDDGTFGTHGRDVNFVLNALDEIMETFLNTFLKANQK
jgi:hypothetical protein